MIWLLMLINVKLLAFSRLRNTLISDYEINNIPLIRVDTIKDLGVLYDNKFSFTQHIDQIVSRANKVSGFIKRQCRDFINVEAIRNLYVSLVRSILEHCSNIWNPHYNIHL